MTDILQHEAFTLIASMNPVPADSMDNRLGADAEELLGSILSQTPHNRLRAGKRRLAIAGLSLACVAGLGGAATAAGLVPKGVTSALLSVSPAHDKVRDATLMVERVNANGIRDQIWVGHNSSGGWCEYLRTVAPGGHREDGAVGCASGPATYQPDSGASFTASFDAAGKAWPPLTYLISVHTTIGDIARMTLTYPDGGTVPLTFNAATGWGLGEVPPSRTTSTSRLIAYDRAGRVLVEERMEATTGRR